MKPMDSFFRSHLGDTFLGLDAEWGTILLGSRNEEGSCVDMGLIITANLTCKPPYLAALKGWAMEKAPPGLLLDIFLRWDEGGKETRYYVGTSNKGSFTTYLHYLAELTGVVEA